MKKIIWVVAFILGLCTAPLQAAETDYASWLENFRAEAAGKGISAKTLTALNNFEPDETVIKLDNSQPEHKITFATYRKNILAISRIKRGKLLYAEHKKLLNQVTERYGVAGKYLVALWAIESSFGSQKGNFSVLRSLATLAYEGRRAELFRTELLAALKIIESGDSTAENLKGSWAGAMGQCQFMPSTYLHYAVDGDADGVRDIWDNEADVFASMANYLKHEGWQAKIGWGIAVQVRKKLPETLVGIAQKGKTLGAWQKLGVKLKKGSVLAAPATRLYYLVQPDGAKGTSYLVTDNYKAVMRWNHSTYFATAVGLLADSIAP
jgi:membrane-bound lytic murein transglycosylase B